MITGAVEGGVSYIFTSVPQIPPTSILSRALSAGISGKGKSRISVLLGPTLTAASTFSKASFSSVPLLRGFGGARAFALARGAHVAGIDAESIARNPCHVGVSLGGRIQTACRITDCRVSHANA